MMMYDDDNDNNNNIFVLNSPILITLWAVLSCSSQFVKPVYFLDVTSVALKIIQPEITQQSSVMFAILN